MDIDYNLHKSNSTYFSDLDISRGALVYALLSRGIHGTELAEELKGGGALILGGVSCSFKREIMPLATYDMSSRIVSWDRKWIYVVTQFVRKGQGKGGGQDLPRKSDKPVVYASAVSRYVFKCGRLTVPPETLLRASGLLPPGHMDMDVDNTVRADDSTGGWDWSKVEAERQQGLRMADCFGGLDVVFDEF
jgi:Thioesterase-like superfamily